MLDEIIGNSHIKSYLQDAVSREKVPNTLIFSGIDGIGKSLFAKKLAYLLMQDKRVFDEKHPDLHIYKPSGKSYMHSVSDIRDLCKDIFRIPFEASCKVFLVMDAHLMSEVVANTLLKSLEEPLFTSYIVLITDRLEDILETIVSRATVIKFSHVSDEELIALLKRWGKTDSESRRIAALSGGSVGRACEIASFVDVDNKTKMLLDILSGNISRYSEFSKALEYLLKADDPEKEKRDLEVIFFHIFIWYRDLNLMREGIFKRLFFFDSLELLKEAENVLSCDLVQSYIDKTKDAIRCNISKKNCLENLFLKLGLF